VRASEQSKIENRNSKIPQWHPQPGPQPPRGFGAGAAAFPVTCTASPPEMTRFTGSPVVGSARNGSSFMLCFTSKRRTGLEGSVVS
jgi:hypothetical protein